MNLTRVIDASKAFVKKHSSEILTVVGCASVVTVGVLSAKATVKAVEDIKNEEADREATAAVMSDPETEGTESIPQPLTNIDIFKLTWKHYIPVVMVGGIGIAAIIMANRLDAKRIAMLASAWSISESKLKEYKEKAKEFLGEEKSEKIDNEINQKQLDLINPDGIVIDPRYGCMQWAVEPKTGHVFPVNGVNDIEKFENRLNNVINWQGYATMNDLFSIIRWDFANSDPFWDGYGWDGDNGLMHIEVVPTIVQWASRPVLYLKYVNPPKEL